MRTTQQMSITLPTELAELVKGKVASGEYASDSEVVRDGLRALLARDRAVEAWLRNEIVPEYDRMMAEELAGKRDEQSTDEVRAAIGLKRRV